MMDIDTTSGEVITNTFELLPSDWYTAQAIEATLEPKGNGQQLKLTWEILDGPHEKRRVWQSEWAAHSSPDAQEIGQRMIRTLGKAAGVTRVSHPDDLKFKPMQIRVGLTKKEPGYEQRNEVKSARPLGAVAPQPTTQAVGAASGGARPWGAAAA